MAEGTKAYSMVMAEGQLTLRYPSQGGCCPWCRIELCCRSFFIHTNLGAHTSAHTSSGAHTGAHMSVHTSLGGNIQVQGEHTFSPKQFSNELFIKNKPKSSFLERLADGRRPLLKTASDGTDTRLTDIAT